MSDAAPTRRIIRAGSASRSPPTGGWGSGPTSASSCARQLHVRRLVRAYLLLLVRAVGGGSESYHAFLDWSATRWVLTMNVIAFLFVVFHAVTFFEAVPQAIVVHLGRHRVPGYLSMVDTTSPGRRCPRSLPGCSPGPEMVKRHPEPFLWLLFSAGGVISAMLMPILLLLFGIAVPLRWMVAPDYQQCCACCRIL